MVSKKEKQTAKIIDIDNNANNLGIMVGENHAPITVVAGITEERTRAIIDEKLAEVLERFSQEARVTAQNRNEAFSADLIPKLVKENLVSYLADPSILILLGQAQKTAAATERLADYALLSELLVHRIKKGQDRNIRAGVSRAIEIVDSISDEALLGLTLVHAANTLEPATGFITKGLATLDDLYGKIIKNEFLPLDSNWLDHLDILDTIRINSFRSFSKISQWMPEKISGYVDVGILVDSAEHQTALNIIKNNNLPKNILIAHELNCNYVRIPVANKAAIDHLQIPNRQLMINIPLSESQKRATIEIYDLYLQDQNLKKENIEKFMEQWRKYPNLKTLENWWNNLPQYFTITAVGRVLAHANVQRCDPMVPPLDGS